MEGRDGGSLPLDPPLFFSLANPNSDHSKLLLYVVEVNLGKNFIHGYSGKRCHWEVEHNFFRGTCQRSKLVKRIKTN